MKKVFFFIYILCAVLLAACAHVEPTAAGNAVRVAYDGKVEGCREAGMVAATVADRLAFYHRNEYTVADELETMARNEAAALPADTIVPRGEAKDGSQRFQAYVCGKTQLRQREGIPQPGTQTFPMKDR